MLGFYAEAKSTFIRRNDNEVEDVQWFDVNQLRNFASYGKSLPRLDSIARRLIEDWLETKV
jgi:NAD+ diphosphatase